MKFMGYSKAGARRIGWLTMPLTVVFLSPVQSGDQRSASTTVEKHAGAAIRIFDQNGQQARSGPRPAGGQIFDVAVGPSGNKIRFVPDTLNISVGDTVRWTWGSDDHSVTSGTPCTADGQFCSPDDMNCDSGILNNTGFVYEHTFTQAGAYSYFCALHCFAGMTGVVNVTPTPTPTPTATATPTPTATPSRSHPTPRPRPTPHPRPVPHS